MRFGYVILGLVTLVCVHTSSGQDTNLCENNLVGFQSEDICCAESCGTCGGSGCGSLDGGAANCCVRTITRDGMMCSETMSAPCIVDPVEMCDNGLPGIQEGDICCDVDCGECGGGGCAGRPGGRDNCCTSRIRENDMMCGETMAAPCIIENDSMCDNGLPGVQNGDICCSASCGTCGGSGCAGRPGGSSSCCRGRIRENGMMCDTTMAAPCIINDPTPAPTETPTPAPTEMPVSVCSNGFAGVQSGTICCEEMCGTCGGSGCGGLPGGQDNCCTGPIGSSGMMCSTTMQAPCIIDNAVTPSPTALAVSP